MNEFKIGDRVLYKNNKSGYNLFDDEIGTVICYKGDLVKVRFNNSTNGWLCYPHNLQFYNGAIIIDESEMEKFL